MNDTPRPLFLLRLFQGIAFVGAIPFVVNTLDVLLNASALSAEGRGILYRVVPALIVAPCTLVIALLCVRRAPKNLIGWMLVAFAYGTSSLSMRRDMLSPTATIFIANAFVSIFWLSYLLIPLYFPDGYLYPPRLNRWGNRIIAFLIVVPFAVFPYIFNRTMTYGTGANAVSVPNPFFIVEFDFTVITVPVGIFGLIGLGLVTLILRYRNGNALERLQLRWLLAGAVGQIGLVISLSWIQTLGINTVSLSSLYTLVIPVSIGIAVLRYRLYEIDIIIRRTLIYSVLTAILATVYFGSVVLMQQAFRTVTGQSSDLAIVISTLAIAALFTPLRRRIQNRIDRRFYRRKYDAEQTLARFNQTLRDEVDIETLKAQLVGVVQETMQPESIGLWLKEDMP